MIETMIEYHGVGLAAPQVHESVRLFVATIDPADDERGDPKPVVIINPEITPVGSEIIEDWEGCLSIPDIRGRVPRAREIVLRAFDRHGERIELHVHSYSGARHPARDGPSGRDPLLRSDAIVRFADVPRRILAVLGEGRLSLGVPLLL